MSIHRNILSRRHFLQMASVSFLLAACGEGTQPATQAPASQIETTATKVPATEAAQVEPTIAPTEAVPNSVATLEPTPMCADDDEETPPQTEGPYFTPNSPERTSLLEDGIVGTKLILSGSVVSTTCQPIVGALIDFWQANDAGEYDNVGYQLRGHQFTNEQGRYSLETIMPGLYPGRTRHIHVKVQAPNSPVLTTQVYFPNEPQNERDGIFNPVLLVDLLDEPDGKRGSFTFVL